MRQSEGYATGRFVTNNLHWCAPCTSLSCPAAIDDQRRACHKCRLVRGQVERSIRDLIRSPHTSDGLTSMKLLPHFILVAGEMARQVAFHKRRMNRAGADSVAANPPRDEINGNRARQRQYSPLARTVGQTPVD